MVQPFYVATLIREVLLIKHVYKSCVIIITSKESLKFDIILGVDWLAAYHAIINYYEKTIKFRLIREFPFIV